MKGIEIEVPWWMPHAYLKAKEQGFKGSLSDFINELILAVYKDE